MNWINLRPMSLVLITGKFWGFPKVSIDGQRNAFHSIVNQVSTAFAKVQWLLTTVSGFLVKSLGTKE